MQWKRNIYESGKGNSLMNDQKISEYAQHRSRDSHTYGNERKMFSWGYHLQSSHGNKHGKYTFLWMILLQSRKRVLR